MRRDATETAGQSVSLPFALTPIGLDGWADVRQLHALAFEKLVGAGIDARDVAAFKIAVTSWSYTQDIQAARLTGAFVDGYLVGTCGWLPADDTGVTARVMFLYVNPMFSRLGFGRQLLGNAERHAFAAGFRALAVRTPVNAVEFFGGLGFEVASYGVHSFDPGAGFPVAFMRKALAAN